MANDLNRVTLIGRLVRDPELKQIPSGISVANFSIANNRKYKDQEDVSYFECIAWGKLGEIIAQYCKKGKLICVDGRLQQRSWEDKDGNKRYKVEVVVENFQFLSPAGENTVAPKTEDAGENPFSDNDVPF